MDPHLYLHLKKAIIKAGYEDDVKWATTVADCQSPDEFAFEYIYVVCNSGMKQQIARKIYDRIIKKLTARRSRASQSFGVDQVFRHRGKVNAIVEVWKNRGKYYDEYLQATDKLSYLESLPWIGPITKFHLAKNFGVDCCKPDRHLMRIAQVYNMTPDELCFKLAEQTGDRIGLVDLVIWRAANLGML